MPFRPAVHDILTIDGLTFVIPPHPQSAMYPFAQEGGRATVYRLNAGDQVRAIKVFKPAYQTPQVAETAMRMRPYASLPGLGVCDRIVLQPDAYQRPPMGEPDLNWAVVMPWVDGMTWYDIITEPDEEKRMIKPVILRELVARYLDVLVELERSGVTHCDLSPGNILIRMNPPAIDLIDVEEICAHGMPIPENVPRGTPGYMHSTAQIGMWHPFADRFAGAVLLCELICWEHPLARAHVHGDSFFAPEEAQQVCQRYQVMNQVLFELCGPDVPRVFERLWFSKTLAEAPAFWEWARALQGYFRRTRPFQPPTDRVLAAQLDHTIAEYARRIQELTQMRKPDQIGQYNQLMQWLILERRKIRLPEAELPSTINPQPPPIQLTVQIPSIPPVSPIVWYAVAAVLVTVLLTWVVARVGSASTTSSPSQSGAETLVVVATSVPNATSDFVPTITLTPLPSSNFNATTQIRQATFSSNCGVSSADVSVTASTSGTAGYSQNDGGEIIDYSPVNMLDCLRETAWRTPYRGVEEVVRFDFSRPVVLTSFAMVPGYDKTDPYTNTWRWYQNRRISSVRMDVHMTDGTVCQQTWYTLSDEAVMQQFTISCMQNTVAVTAIDMYVVGSLPPSSTDPRDFIAISDVDFQGNINVN